MNGRLFLSVPEAADLIGISRGAAYEAVKRGEIPSRRFGRRVLVPRAALLELASVQAQEVVLDPASDAPPFGAER